MAPKGVGPPAIRRGTPGCRSLVRTSDKHVSVPCRTSLKEVIQPHLPIRLPCYDFTPVIGHTVASALRSEEHTSELQSLMRISYAVFCLKKKKYQYITTTEH